MIETALRWVVFLSISSFAGTYYVARRVEAASLSSLSAPASRSVEAQRRPSAPANPAHAVGTIEMGDITVQVARQVDRSQPAPEQDVQVILERARNLMTGAVGIPVDLAAAHRLFLQAAELGSAEAQFYVGNDLLSNRGVDVDPVEALIWLKKSVASGFERAKLDIPIAEQEIAQFYVGLNQPRIVSPDLVVRGRRIQDCARCPVMIVLPRGSFMMGGKPEEPGHSLNEEPRHLVRIDRDIAVSETLITFEQWDACVQAGKCATDVNDMGWGRGDQPAINISWDDVRSYIEWLNSITSGGYRLLSEAEWEYAAKAGSDTTYWWGDEMEAGRANCRDCNPSALARTAPVKSFPASPFGLFDMSGNAWQWVSDCVGNALSKGKPNYVSAPATGQSWLIGNSAALDCSVRIVRGGAWDYDASFARASARNWYFTVNRYSDSNLGFRIVLSFRTKSNE
jgi:formylglycine-generating enzyme required for sulfatase activity